ncbi:hypothetical protein K456DRAFT_1090276 [Colletotrichum gloeosporioides 23]|nr:hypothetical protein K456DRAFT_1090276 [Colletotrichum gloeosporioides 23]
MSLLVAVVTLFILFLAVIFLTVVIPAVGFLGYTKVYRSAVLSVSGALLGVILVVAGFVIVLVVDELLLGLPLVLTSRV